MRARMPTMLIVVSVVMELLLAQRPSQAQSVHDAAPSGTPSKRVCVDVEVDDERTLSYDCLTQRLAPAAQPEIAASQSAAQALANGPSNRVGTFNLSAERNRFGANWGKSPYPQRPQPAQGVPSGR